MNDVKTLIKLIFDLESVVNDFLPNIGHCALQDYGMLNDVLVRVEALKKEVKTTP